MIINAEEKQVLLQLKLGDGKSLDDAKFEIERDVAFIKNKKLDEIYSRKRRKRKTRW